MEKKCVFGLAQVLDQEFKIDFLKTVIFISAFASHTRFIKIKAGGSNEPNKIKWAVSRFR